MKILVIGASGFLGKNLCYRLKNKHTIYGTYFKRFDYKLDGMYQIDACRSGDIKRILEEIEPDIVIWSIMSRTTETKTMEIGLRELLNYAKISKAQVIYISTDLFKGGNGYYKESYEAQYFDDKNPNVSYFNGKVLGEKMTLKLKDSIVIRIGMIYGIDYFNKRDRRISHMMGKLNNDEQVILNGNIYKTYTDIRFLAEVIESLIETKFKGILHVVNTERASIYEFYKKQLEEIVNTNALIIEDFLDEVEGSEKDICLDTSMCNCKLLRLIESGQICTSYNKRFTARSTLKNCAINTTIRPEC